MPLYSRSSTPIQVSLSLFLSSAFRCVQFCVWWIPEKCSALKGINQNTGLTRRLIRKNITALYWVYRYRGVVVVAAGTSSRVSVDTYIYFYVFFLLNIKTYSWEWERERETKISFIKDFFGFPLTPKMSPTVNRIPNKHSHKSIVYTYIHFIKYKLVYSREGSIFYDIPLRFSSQLSIPNPQSCPMYDCVGVYFLIQCGATTFIYISI